MFALRKSKWVCSSIKSCGRQRKSWAPLTKKVFFFRCFHWKGFYMVNNNKRKTIPLLYIYKSISYLNFKIIMQIKEHYVPTYNFIHLWNNKILIILNWINTKKIEYIVDIETNKSLKWSNSVFPGIICDIYVN